MILTFPSQELATSLDDFDIERVPLRDIPYCLASFEAKTYSKRIGSISLLDTHDLTRFGVPEELKKFPYLNKLKVDYKYQRNGIGRVLLQRMLKHVDEDICSPITLVPSPQMDYTGQDVIPLEKLIRFYDDHGFIMLESGFMLRNLGGRK